MSADQMSGRRKKKEDFQDSCLQERKTARKTGCARYLLTRCLGEERRKSKKKRE